MLFLDAINLELTELRRDWLVPVLVLGPATPFSSWYARKASQETLAEERAGTAAELFTQTPDDVPRITPAGLAERLAEPHPPLILDVRSGGSASSPRRSKAA